MIHQPAPNGGKLAVSCGGAQEAGQHSAAACSLPKPLL